MSPATTAPDWLNRLKSRGRRNLVFWALGIVIWLYLLIVTDWQLLAITAWSVPFLLMIAAVSTPWRSVSWTHLVSLFMVGMGPVYLLGAVRLLIRAHSEAILGGLFINFVKGRRCYSQTAVTRVFS